MTTHPLELLMSGVVLCLVVVWACELIGPLLAPEASAKRKRVH